MASWDEEGLDPEGPSTQDLERFGAETRVCGQCGAEVWDQADDCHRCGASMAEHPDKVHEQRSKVGMLIVLLLIAMLGGAIAYF